MTAYLARNSTSWFETDTSHLTPSIPSSETADQVYALGTFARQARKVMYLHMRSVDQVCLSRDGRGCPTMPQADPLQRTARSGPGPLDW